MNATKRQAAKTNANALQTRIARLQAQIVTAPAPRQTQIVREIAKLRQARIASLNA